METRIDRAELTRQAIELRRLGWSIKGIARLLDISHDRAAYLVQKGINLGVVERKHIRHRYRGTCIETGTVRHFDGGTALQEAGFNRGCVWAAARGHQKKHGGYVWELVDALTQ